VTYALIAGIQSSDAELPALSCNFLHPLLKMYATEVESSSANLIDFLSFILLLLLVVVVVVVVVVVFRNAKGFLLGGDGTKTRQHTK
jgi:heme/copper-type cytochrome/quinol oxidase subunit 2